MKTRSRLRFWLLTLCSFCLIAVVAVLAGQRIVAWMWAGFGRQIIDKTQFTPSEEGYLKERIGLPLPAGATIDWGRACHGFQSWDFVFRVRLSWAEAHAFRQRVESSWVQRDGIFSEFLAWIFDGDETKPEVDAAFSIEDANVDGIVFCRPDGDKVSVLFWIASFPRRQPGEIERMFFR